VSPASANAASAKTHPLLRRPEPQVSAAGSELAGMAEAVARLMRTTLRESGLNATLGFGSALGRHEPLGAVLDRQKGKAVACTFTAELVSDGDEPCQIILLIDHPLVHAMTDGLLGADGSEQPVALDRPLTRIELRIARLVAERAGRALAAGLAERLASPLRLISIETNFDFVEAGPREARRVALPLAISLLGQSGTLLALLPEPVIAGPASPEAEENAGEDQGWSERFGAEVTQADVLLTARFEARGIMLGDVARWRAGTHLSLGADARLLLDCGTETIFSGEIGQSEGRYALRIERAATSQSRSRG